MKNKLAQSLRYVLVYVCHPYSDDPEKRRDEALAAATEIRAAGGVPIVPHNLFIGVKPLPTWAEAMAACMPILADCHAIYCPLEPLIVAKKVRSQGCEQELRWSRNNDRPVWSSASDMKNGVSFLRYEGCA